MGMYMYVTEQDRVDKRKVTQKDINDLFQEALGYCPSLMIQEHSYQELKRVGFLKFKKVTIYYYDILHETPAHDGSAYQAMFMLSACGEKKDSMNYLYGIINGAMAVEERFKKIKNKP